jgi:hypothetical protein
MVPTTGEVWWGVRAGGGRLVAVGITHWCVCWVLFRYKTTRKATLPTTALEKAPKMVEPQNFLQRKAKCAHYLSFPLRIFEIDTAHAVNH